MYLDHRSVFYISLNENPFLSYDSFAEKRKYIHNSTRRCQNLFSNSSIIYFCQTNSTIENTQRV